MRRSCGTDRSELEIRGSGSASRCVQKGTDAPSGPAYDENDRREITVLSTIVMLLVVLWLLGMGTSYTMGGLLHILLVIAIIVVLLRVIQGRNPISG